MAKRHRVSYFMLLKLKSFIDKFSDTLGVIASALLIFLLVNVFYDVIMRYLFNDVSIGFQELEWHLYASIFMLGISYTIKNDGHVRVDVIYDKLGYQAQAWINIGGVLLFILPFAGLVFWYSLNFVAESYTLGEKSGDPGGLHFRWLIKSIIPIAFASIVLSSIGMLISSVLILIAKGKPVTRGRAM